MEHIHHTTSAPSALMHAADNKSSLHHKLPAAGYWTTSLMIFKSIVGAGLFALPFAVKLMGVVGTFFSMLSMGLLTFYTCVVVVRVHDVVVRDTLSPNLTFVSLTTHTLGAKWAKFVYFMMVLTTVGSVGSFLVFNGMVLHSIFPGVSTVGFAGAVAACMLPFSLINSPKFLAYSSIGGNIGLVVVVLVQFVAGAGVRHEFASENIEVFNSETFWSALGIVGFLFSCSRSILTIEKAMTEKRRFTSALWVTMCVVFVFCCIFAYVNYLYFDKDVCSVVVLNLGDTFASKIAKYSIVIDLAFTIPIVMAPMIEIVAKTFFTDDTPHLGLKVGMLRILTLGACFLIALFPNFNIIVSLVGAMSAAIFQFILPAMMLLKLRQKHVTAHKQQHATSLLSPHDPTTGLVLRTSPLPDASMVVNPPLDMRPLSEPPTPVSHTSGNMSDIFGQSQESDRERIISPVASLPRRLPLFGNLPHIITSSTHLPGLLHKSPSPKSSPHSSPTPSPKSTPMSGTNNGHDAHAHKVGAHEDFKHPPVKSAVIVQGHRLVTRPRDNTAYDIQTLPRETYVPAPKSSLLPLGELPSQSHARNEHHGALGGDSHFAHKHHHPHHRHHHKKEHKHTEALLLLGVGDAKENAFLYGVVAFGAVLFVLVVTLSLRSAFSGQDDTPQMCRA